MEFNEKLQELRKQKGITQEELAEKLFVSRTAVSKWESARGYPNIESLKAIAKFFNTTVDQLLSGDELLTLSEEDVRKKEEQFRDVTFGLLDVGAFILAFLPFFGQETNGLVHGVSLISLTGIATYLQAGYYAVLIGIVAWGITTLALQKCQWKWWVHSKHKLSLLFNTVGVILFIISRQPYAASFLLLFLIIKALMLLKRR